MEIRLILKLHLFLPNFVQYTLNIKLSDVIYYTRTRDPFILSYPGAKHCAIAVLYAVITLFNAIVPAVISA